MAEKIALYTCVHKAVLKYVPAWYESVRSQTDNDFDIWITLDGVEAESVAEVVGDRRRVTLLRSVLDETRAEARQIAFERMSERYPAIVFVDADDILEPTRIEAAKKALVLSDVSACAMRIIDEAGHDMGVVFEPSRNATLSELLMNNNVFGLGNTAYKAEVVRKCLPIPPQCELVDWFMATRAYSAGAKLDFDFAVGMGYRQYLSNTARVLPPFEAEYVLRATELVSNHYQLLLNPVGTVQPWTGRQLEVAREYVDEFHTAITGSAETLGNYVSALNELPAEHVWWSCVANSRLESIWRR